MIEVPHLEWHITHSCNFTCDGCGHFNNDGYREDISIDRLKVWYSAWNKRIRPKELSILGGEPLIHKNLIDIIYLTKEMWNIQDDQYFELVTNGFLLDNHPQLPKVLKETNCVLCVTIHSDDSNYQKILKKSLQKIEEWTKEYGITTFTHDAVTNWIKVYKGYGKYIEPFESDDYIESWNNCPGGQENFQLFDGKIYKCATLAYLPIQKIKYGDELSSKWDPYLMYKPLDSNCSDQDIHEFFSRTAESVCSMCPKNGKTFKKRSPLYSVNYVNKLIMESKDIH